MVSVLGIDPDNVDGLEASLGAHFDAHRKNGDILLNLEDARKGRLDGRTDGPKKNAPRPPYVHRPYPTARHHADGRTKVCENAGEVKAAEDIGFRKEPYPVVRVAPADPAAEKAAKIAQDVETAGKIAAQNDLIIKLAAQVDALSQAAKKPGKGAKDKSEAE